MEPYQINWFYVLLYAISGMRSYIDVGAITGESGESHYFINVADVHL